MGKAKTLFSAAILSPSVSANNQPVNAQNANAQNANAQNANAQNITSHQLASLSDGTGQQSEEQDINELIGPAKTPITEEQRQGALEALRFRQLQEVKLKKVFLHPRQTFSQLNKEQKVLVVNAGAMALTAIVGLAYWEYGSSPFHSKSEGWFGEDSKYGGADKLGHYYSTFALSEALRIMYERWGYESNRAIWLAALSSWVVMGLMEVGDSFSKEHGFSYEDMTMNSLGALTSWFLQRHPALDEKIDIRLQYDFNVTPTDVFTDYENMKYILALKAEGFPRARNTPLRFLELQVGYYERGYHMPNVTPEDRTRNLYAGIYANFSHILRRRGRHRFCADGDVTEPRDFWNTFNRLTRHSTNGTKT